ncbi:MAG: metal-dependent hydrolase, partial [Gaiellaceae bacterium]
SWVAHDIEPYVIQKHLGKRIAFVPLLLGSYAPDMATKWFVYGTGIFGFELKADNPAQFHRGWPGVGFTHSLMFGVAVALLIFVISRSRIWAISFLIGQWAHALTDTLDTVGTMLFFPFTDHLFAAGAWAYAGQTGRYTDAGAYFSGLGFVWDGIFLVWGALSWRVLTREYFRETIVPADPFWGKAGRYLSETALVAIYRISFFYGACRWVAWLIWAHVVRSFAFDLSWGGPKWVDAVRSKELNASGCKCPSCCSVSPKLALSLAVAVGSRVRRSARPRAGNT